MPSARIYRPDKTAMQSGKAKMHRWVLEFVPDAPYFVEDLMGWTGMTDTKNQLLLRFPTKEAAIAYANAKKLPYELSQPNPRTQVPKAYADNFKFDRVRG